MRRRRFHVSAPEMGDFAEFEIKAGNVSTSTDTPIFRQVANPSNLIINEQPEDKIGFRWDTSPDTLVDNIYAHSGDSPTYNLMQSNYNAITAEHYSTAKKPYKHSRVHSRLFEGTKKAGKIVHAFALSVYGWTSDPPLLLCSQ